MTVLASGLGQFAPLLMCDLARRKACPARRANGGPFVIEAEARSRTCWATATGSTTAEGARTCRWLAWATCRSTSTTVPTPPERSPDAAARRRASLAGSRFARAARVDGVVRVGGGSPAATSAAAPLSARFASSAPPSSRNDRGDFSHCPSRGLVPASFSANARSAASSSRVPASGLPPRRARRRQTGSTLRSRARRCSSAAPRRGRSRCTANPDRLGHRRLPRPGEPV